MTRAGYLIDANTIRITRTSFLSLYNLSIKVFEPFPSRRLLGAPLASLACCQNPPDGVARSCASRLLTRVVQAPAAKYSYMTVPADGGQGLPAALRTIRARTRNRIRRSASARSRSLAWTQQEETGARATGQRNAPYYMSSPGERATFFHTKPRERPKARVFFCMALPASPAGQRLGPISGGTCLLEILTKLLSSGNHLRR